MVKEIIESFFAVMGDKKDQVYNEISLQLELGCFLRETLPKGYQAWFEKPVQRIFNEGVLKKNGSEFVKKEIDLLITDKDKKVISCVELKYPKNGQYPQQMAKFCQDIRFLEQLHAVGVKECLFVCLADDDLFYSYKKGRKTNDIYSLFRTDSTGRPGVLDPAVAEFIPAIRELGIEHTHRLEWRNITNLDSYRYMLVD